MCVSTVRILDVDSDAEASQLTSERKPAVGDVSGRSQGTWKNARVGISRTDLAEVAEARRRSGSRHSPL